MSLEMVAQELGMVNEDVSFGIPAAQTLSQIEAVHVGAQLQ